MSVASSAVALGSSICLVLHVGSLSTSPGLYTPVLIVTGCRFKAAASMGNVAPIACASAGDVGTSLVPISANHSDVGSSGASSCRWECVTWMGYVQTM